MRKLLTGLLKITVMMLIITVLLYVSRTPQHILTYSWSFGIPIVDFGLIFLVLAGLGVLWSGVISPTTREDSVRVSTVLALLGAVNPLSLAAIYLQSPQLLGIVALGGCLLNLVLTIQGIIKLQRLDDSSEAKSQGFKFFLSAIIFFSSTIGLAAYLFSNLGYLRQLFQTILNDVSATTVPLVTTGTLIAVESFQDIWIQHWLEPLIQLAFVGITIVATVRLYTLVAYKNISPLSKLIFTFVFAFLSILIFLPVASGNLIATNYSVRQPAQWSNLSEQLIDLREGTLGDVLFTDISESSTSRLLLFQDEIEFRNSYLLQENDITSVVENLTGGEVISVSKNVDEYQTITSYLQSDLPLSSIIENLDIDYIVQVSGPASQSNTSVLSSKLLEQDLLQVYWASENDNSAIYQTTNTSTPNTYLADWDYTYIQSQNELSRQVAATTLASKVIYETTSFELSKINTQNGEIEVELAGEEPVGSEAENIGDGIQDDDFLVNINDQSFIKWEQSQDNLQLNSSQLSSVRLFNRYQQSDLIEVADFREIRNCQGEPTTNTTVVDDKLVFLGRRECIQLAEIAIETSAAAVLELELASNINEGVNMSVCLFDNQDQSCVVTYDTEDQFSTSTRYLRLFDENSRDYALRITFTSEDQQENSRLELSSIASDEWELVAQQTFQPLLTAPAQQLEFSENFSEIINNETYRVQSRLFNGGNLRPCSPEDVGGNPGYLVGFNDNNLTIVGTVDRRWCVQIDELEDYDLVCLAQKCERPDVIPVQIGNLRFYQPNNNSLQISGDGNKSLGAINLIGLE